MGVDDVFTAGPIDEATAAPHYMTRREVRDWFGLGRNDTERAFRELTTYRVRPGGNVYVKRAELEDWIDKHAEAR